MKIIKISKLKCIKCKHIWIPRNGQVFVCPNCHTKYFQKPYKREEKK